MFADFRQFNYRKVDEYFSFRPDSILRHSETAAFQQRTLDDNTDKTVACNIIMQVNVLVTGDSGNTNEGVTAVHILN